MRLVKSDRRKKTVAVLEIYLVISLVFLLSISFNSKPVQAPEDNSGTASCCQKAKTGEYCIEGLTAEQCEEGYAGGVNCGQAANGCENRGCCNVNNQCTKGAIQAACQGEYYPNEECNIEQCQPKCCVLGTSCGLMSQSACQEAGGTINQDATDIISCSRVCETKTKGCCKTEDKYENTAGDNCQGEFFPNQPCKRVENSNCNENNPTTGCLGNDLYSYNSCGDPTLVKKCDSRQGEICGDKNGDSKFACEDMNCQATWDNPLVDENGDENLLNDGRARKQGESWCEYQSAVGPGMDLPGTAHYLHSCVNGKEEVKMCGQGNRDQICVYFDVDESNNYPFFSGEGKVAQCIDNEYESCLSCNDISLDPEKREEAGQTDTRASCCQKAGLCQWMGVGKTTELESIGGLEFIYVPDTKIISFLDRSYASPDFLSRKEKDLLKTTGKIYIFDKEIQGKLSDATLLFISDEKVEHNKSLGEARVTDEEWNEEDQIAYTYTLKLDTLVTKFYDINISYGNINEFVVNFEMPAAIEEQGSCIPLVPPGNIPIKILDKNTYAQSVQKADEECDKASNKEINSFWLEGFWPGQGWDCKNNCDVYPERNTTFIKGQNFVCNSYGDCGAKWSLTRQWSNRAYYYDCGDLSQSDQKDECKKKLYYLDTPPQEFKFENYKTAGKGFYLGKSNTDFALSSSSGSGSNWWIAGGSLLSASLVGTTILYGGVAIGAALFTGGTGGGVLAALLGIKGGTTLIVLEGIGAIGLAALVVLGIGAIAFIATYLILLGLQEHETRYSSTVCESWKPPTQNECWKCHIFSNETKDHKACNYGSEECGLLPALKTGPSDGYQCTPQLCSSLGKDCLWQDSEIGPKCIEQKERDVNSPIIKIKEIKYECNNGGCSLQAGANPSGVQGTTEITGEVKPGHTVIVWLETVNPADNGADLTKCRYTFEPQKLYEEMDEFGDGLSFEHKIEFNSIEPGEKELYLACEDIVENNNEDKYLIKFKVAEYPDIAAPIIREINTPTGSGNWNVNEGQKETAYIAYGQETIALELVLNEKTPLNGCKWTNVSANVEFENMNKHFSCQQPSDITKPYQCTGQIGIPEEKTGENKEHKVWFRCVDLEGNKALQSLPFEGFKIKKTEALNITEVKCVGQFSEKCEGIIYDKEITISISTQGGVDGTSRCSWNRGEGDIDFRNPDLSDDQIYTATNVQPGYNLLPGENKLVFRCQDKAGNTATKEATFKHEKDEQAPKITKIYQSNGQLTIDTNEYATCRYALTQEEQIEYNKEGNELLRENNGMKHTLSLQNNYYKIGCIDRFENVVGPFNVYVESTS